MGLGALLFALLFGLYLRRKSEKKSLGNVFILLGTLPLLPFVLIGILLYWLVKKVRSGKKIEAPTLLPYYPENSTNAQLLDEWERKMKMEEK